MTPECETGPETHRQHVKSPENLYFTAGYKIEFLFLRQLQERTPCRPKRTNDDICGLQGGCKHPLPHTVPTAAGVAGIAPSPPPVPPPAARPATRPRSARC